MQGPRSENQIVKVFFIADYFKRDIMTKNILGKQFWQTLEINSKYPLLYNLKAWNNI